MAQDATASATAHAIDRGDMTAKLSDRVAELRCPCDLAMHDDRAF
jgi:hypothetical protein